jgi:type IV secretion system protein VirD4
MNTVSPSLKVLRLASILAILAAVVWLGFTAYRSADTVTRAMYVKGWTKTANVSPKADLFTFGFRCVFTAPNCEKVFTPSFTQRIPSWMLYTPLLGFIGLIIFRILSIPRPEKDPGEARWATPKDMSAYIGERPEDTSRYGYLGLLEGKTKDVVRLPENARCAHTLIIGGTGAGKTTRYVNPNLLLDARDGASAVVFDLKYPDPRSGFLETINYFKAWGRNVYPFTPFDPDSVRIPLLAGVQTIQDAIGVAEAFRPFGEAEGGAEFYKNNERQLLAGLFLAVSQEPNPSLKRVFELLGGGSAALQKYLKEKPIVRNFLATLLELRADQMTGICTGLMGDLLAFTNPNLNRATSMGPGDTLDLEKICDAPSFLYIGIPQEEIQGGQGQVLLRLIKRMIDRAILSACSKNNGRLKTHLNLYLDEFPSFGPLPNIAENLATMRSRRVAFHIAMQNLAQGQAVYGKEEFAGMINNNFAQMVVFPRSLRLEDATYFAELFGEMTVTEVSTNFMSDGGIVNNPIGAKKRSKSTKLATRFLLSAEAMRTFPDGWAVIETIGAPTAKVFMPRLDQKESPYRPMFEKIKATYPTPVLRKKGVNAAEDPIEGVIPSTVATNIKPSAASLPETSSVALKNVILVNPEPAVAATLEPQNDAAPNKNPVAESFRNWLEETLNSPVQYTAEFAEGGVPERLEFAAQSFAQLPENTSKWIEQGWLEYGEGLVVTRLGFSRVKRLYKLVKPTNSKPASVQTAVQPAQKPVESQAAKPLGDHKPPQLGIPRLSIPVNSNPLNVTPTEGNQKGESL